MTRQEPVITESRYSRHGIDDARYGTIDHMFSRYCTKKRKVTERYIAR